MQSASSVGPAVIVCSRDDQCDTHLCRYGQCWSCVIDSQCASGICRGGYCQDIPKASLDLQPGNQIHALKVPPAASTQTGPGLVIFLASGAAAGVGFARRKKLI